MSVERSASPEAASSHPPLAPAQATRLVGTSFLSLFSIVGLVLYGLPFFYDFFQGEFHWTAKQVTSGNMVGKLVSVVLFGAFAGWLIDRVGPRKPMIFGVLVAGVALIGLGGVHSLTFFYVFYIVNAMGYVFAGPLPNQVLLSRHFGKARGRAMGIAYVGIGVGFAFVPQLSHMLEAAFGWRTAIRCLGVIVVVVAMPLILFLREGDQGAPRTTGAAPRPPLKDVLDKPYFYLLLVGSMASIGAVGGAYASLKLLSKDLHWQQGTIANLLSTIAVASLVGRIGAGTLADVLGPKRTMLIVYSLVTTAMVILVIGPTGPGMFAFAVVFGLGLGGEYLIIPLMAAELFGTVAIGRVMGIVLTMDGVAEALFPFVSGALRDSTGSFSLSFKVLAVLAAAGAIAIMLLPRSGPRARV